MAAVILAGLVPALAQDRQSENRVAGRANAQPTSPPTVGTCVRRPGMLGVARRVEIDTTGGPRFGLQQYKDNDFLRDMEVVLTFDDGPLRRHTKSVLAALSAHCTKATFFMVGRMAASDPMMVREVAQHGHTVALHTWSHRNLKAIGPERAKSEFELGLSTVQKALGRPVAPFFRFPYLADSPAMLDYLSQRNFAVFSIDGDSHDYRTQSGSTMQRNILRSLETRRKGVLLFHDIQTSTARGLKELLDTLASRGFKVVHIVPKASARALPSYDEMAAAELKKRSRTALDDMARRSIVYPISDPDTPTIRYVAARPGAASARPAGVAASERGQLPPRPRQALVVAPPLAQPKPTPTPPPARPAIPIQEDRDDWRARVFNN